ncbi:MAG: xanthine dehydrogenase accessory factor [Chloroflexota bacterium]|nr:xanthine dehydrogenase accessory factor [Chloroflexota bacterium]MEA2668965.1 xanthine dehydrogenase accessory factor [Chloroflexota bacterium]
MGGAALQRGDRIGDDVLELLREYAADGTPCALATVVRVEPPTSARPGDKAVITADGKLRGWIGGSCSEPVVRREALRALAEGTPQMVKIVAAAEVRQTRKRGELMVATTCPSGGSLDIFIEPRLPRPLLLVFGETPVAETLAKLGELTGFRARTVTQAGLANLSVPTGDAWAVVATMGHYDEDAAEAALAHPDLDVSLIASTRRAAAVRSELLARGLDQRMVERLRTPAGKVRGVTQEQIALLALAEIVAARQKRGPKPVHEAPQVVFATDPVCGMTVDPLTATHKAEFGGTTFWFCSAGCQVEFEKTPERYLRPIEA